MQGCDQRTAPSESAGECDASDIEGSAALPSGDNDNE